MNQPEVNAIKFRDAVAEICGRFPELPAKQHALRVESDALEIRHAVRDESGAGNRRKTAGVDELTGQGRKWATYSPRSAWRIVTRTTCKCGLQVQARCSVKPEATDFNATIRKFRTVAREGAWNLESLVARRKTLSIVQPISKNKKGAA